MLRNNTLKKQNSLDVQQQKWLSQDFSFSLYTKLFVLSTGSNDWSLIILFNCAGRWVIDSNAQSTMVVLISVDIKHHIYLLWWYNVLNCKFERTKKKKKKKKSSRFGQHCNLRSNSNLRSYLIPATAFLLENVDVYHLNQSQSRYTNTPTPNPTPTPTRLHALCCGRHSLSVKCIVWRWLAPVKPTQCGQHRTGRGWSQGPPPAPQWNPQPLHARFAHHPTMERVRLTPATPRRLALSVRLILGIDRRQIVGNHSEV